MDEVVAYQQTVGKVVNRCYPHYNHLYSVAALTKVGVNGPEVVERYSYDAYGKQKITDAGGSAARTRSAVGFDRGFTGYITDNETGLLHARARQYSPALGRFVGRDPGIRSSTLRVANRLRKGPMTKDYYADGLNLYMAYFVPVMVDPSGTLTCCTSIGAIRNGVVYSDTADCVGDCLRELYATEHGEFANYVGGVAGFWSPFGTALAGGYYGGAMLGCYSECPPKCIGEVEPVTCWEEVGPFERVWLCAKDKGLSPKKPIYRGSECCPLGSKPMPPGGR